MVSLRFPFSSFPPPPKPPSNTRRATFATAFAAAAATAGIAIKQNQQNPLVDFILSCVPTNNNNNNSPLWASLSLSSEEPALAGASPSFPSVIKEKQTLLGVGLRRKRILGLKNIDVYAFGVYADEDEVQKNLKEKYGKLSAADLKGSEDFNEDLLASDLKLTVRLQIVYSKLSIRSVRSAFEESVGSRLQKFGGPDNKELLSRFTSQFKDELKIPKGSVIELSRDHGHVLHTTIDGQEVGSIQSKLLCQSVFDLYVGEDPFDPKAKENMMLKLAQVFENKSALVG